MDKLPDGRYSDSCKTGFRSCDACGPVCAATCRLGPNNASSKLVEIHTELIGFTVE